MLLLLFHMNQLNLGFSLGLKQKKPKTLPRPTASARNSPTTASCWKTRRRALPGAAPDTIWFALDCGHQSGIIAAFAPVAQLDRVLGYEPRGQEFESLRARQIANRMRG